MCRGFGNVIIFGTSQNILRNAKTLCMRIINPFNAEYYSDMGNKNLNITKTDKQLACLPCNQKWRSACPFH